MPDKRPVTRDIGQSNEFWIASISKEATERCVSVSLASNVAAWQGLVENIAEDRPAEEFDPELVHLMPEGNNSSCTREAQEKEAQAGVSSCHSDISSWLIMCVIRCNFSSFVC